MRIQLDIHICAVKKKVVKEQDITLHAFPDSIQKNGKQESGYEDHYIYNAYIFSLEASTLKCITENIQIEELEDRISPFHQWIMIKYQ